MEFLFLYLFLGFVCAIMNIDYSEKLFLKSTYEQYKTKKMANAIRNIIIFNNVKTIYYRIAVAFSYILFFPCLILIKCFIPNHYKNGVIQKFNFNHKEGYFIDGKEINKILHSQLMRIFFTKNISNF